MQNPIIYSDIYGLAVRGTFLGFNVTDVNIDFKGIEALDPFERDSTGMIQIGNYLFSGSVDFGIKLKCEETECSNVVRTWYPILGGSYYNDNLRVPIRSTWLPPALEIVLKIAASIEARNNFNREVAGILAAYAGAINAKATAICLGTEGLPAL